MCRIKIVGRYIYAGFGIVATTGHGTQFFTRRPTYRRKRNSVFAYYFRSTHLSFSWNGVCVLVCECGVCLCPKASAPSPFAFRLEICKNGRHLLCLSIWLWMLKFIRFSFWPYSPPPPAPSTADCQCLPLRHACVRHIGTFKMINVTSIRVCVCVRLRKLNFV